MHMGISAYKHSVISSFRQHGLSSDKQSEEANSTGEHTSCHVSRTQISLRTRTPEFNLAMALHTEEHC